MEEYDMGKVSIRDILLGMIVVLLSIEQIRDCDQGIKLPAENPSRIETSADINPASDEASVKLKVLDADPSLGNANIHASSIEGLMVIEVDGKRAFVNEAGTHIISGPAIEIGERSKGVAAESHIEVSSKALAGAEYEAPAGREIPANAWPDGALVPNSSREVSSAIVHHIDKVTDEYGALAKSGHINLDSISLAYIANAIPEDRLAHVYPSKIKTRSRITVFADPTCPKCQLLHNDIELLTASGFEVRYVLLPRNANDEELSRDIESVYCANAEQRGRIIEELYRGEGVEAEQCEKGMVERALAAAEFYNVKSTPTIFVEDTGVVFPGYVPASVLIEMDKYPSRKKQVAAQGGRDS